jgi:hypothetical protein
MRFLTVLFMSISLLAAAEPSRALKMQQSKKLKASRGKSFFRVVGSFGAGMLMADPYTGTIEKKSVR